MTGIELTVGGGILVALIGILAKLYIPSKKNNPGNHSKLTNEKLDNIADGMGRIETLLSACFGILSELRGRD